MWKITYTWGGSLHTQIMSTWRRRKKNINDDDDSTIRHHLSNLNGTYEHYCEQYINHRHRVDCYINCVPVFSFFIIILLVPYDISYRYPALTISPKVETGKTWSIFNVLNWNWAGCLLEFHVPYESTIRLYGSIHWIS